MLKRSISTLGEGVNAQGRAACVVCSALSFEQMERLSVSPHESLCAVNGMSRAAIKGREFTYATLHMDRFKCSPILWH